METATTIRAIRWRAPNTSANQGKRRKLMSHHREPREYGKRFHFVTRSNAILYRIYNNDTVIWKRGFSNDVTIYHIILCQVITNTSFLLRVEKIIYFHQNELKNWHIKVFEFTAPASSNRRNIREVMDNRLEKNF